MDKIAPLESNHSELRLRAASGNAGPASVGTTRGRASPAGRKAAAKKPQHWSSSSQVGNGSQSSATSGRQGAQKIKATWKKYKPRFKPRVLLFVCFGAIQVVMLGTFALASASIK
jgi:hypothetical protein